MSDQPYAHVMGGQAGMRRRNDSLRRGRSGAILMIVKTPGARCGAPNALPAPAPPCAPNHPPKQRLRAPDAAKHMGQRTYQRDSALR